MIGLTLTEPINLRSDEDRVEVLVKEAYAAGWDAARSAVQELVEAAQDLAVESRTVIDTAYASGYWAGVGGHAPPPIRKTVERDEQGRITAVIEAQA